MGITARFCDSNLLQERVTLPLLRQLYNATLTPTYLQEKKLLAHSVFSELLVV